MREKGNETHDGCGQMVVDFTIIRINYLMASLFVDLVLPLFYLYCGIRFCGCAICLVSGIATEAAMAYPTSFTKFK